MNTGDRATAAGVELEVRKNIFEKEDGTIDKLLKSNLSIGFNTSYMYSDQKLDSEKVICETTGAGFPLSVDFSFTESRLTGASDLLVNGDLSFYKEFKKDKNILATIAYNYYSDRIFALGTEGKGNIIDKGMGSLDFIVRIDLIKNIGLGLTAKNLLNPTIKRYQDSQDVTVLSYKKGNNFKLSLSYNF